MYSIADYWQMMGDHLRRDAYAEALRRSVKPGAIVVNIGAGTGTFAFMACLFGAARVYAIEHAEIIRLAEALAAANGLSGRIEFVQDLSTNVTLPEQADVIVSDLRGVLPLHGSHLSSISDARRRFLGRGGVLIPQRDSLWVAVVEAPDLYRHLVTPWDRNPYSLNFEAARQLAVNRWSKVRVSPNQLLVEPQLWATLEYELIDGPDVSGELSWGVSRSGTAHGLCVWFVSTLVEGVSFSSAPDEPELIYGTGFFPLTDPVPVASEDVVSVALSANLVGDDYVWRWSTRVQEAGKGGTLKADFQQSNFLASPISTSALRKAEIDNVPTLNENGEIDHAILAMMRGELTLDRIADHISTRFPAQFRNGRDALPRVQHLSQRYGR
jgi:protein arginine N-methyltransferase 1